MSDTDWKGFSGSWTDQNAWTAGIPGSTSTARFNSGKSYQLTFATTASIVALDGLDAGGIFDFVSGTLGLSAASQWNGLFLMAPGVVLQPASDLDLAGSATLNGQIDGGTLDITGVATNDGLIVTGIATIAVGGLLLLNGYGEFGLSGTDDILLSIASGGTLGFLNPGDSSDYITAEGTLALINAGLIDQSALAQSVDIGGDTGTFDNTGTIIVDTTPAPAAGPTGLDIGLPSETIAGTILGSGALYLGGGLESVQTLLDPASLGIALVVLETDTVALGENLSFGGTLLAESGFDGPTVLNLAGHDLTLGGQATLSMQVNGPGTLVISGTADVDALTVSGAELLVTGLAVQPDDNSTSYTEFLSGATLVIAAGGTYVSFNYGVYQLGTGGTLANAGLFVVDDPPIGVDTVLFTSIVNTGTILFNDGVNGLTTEAGVTSTMINDGTIIAAAGILTLDATEIAADQGNSGTIIIDGGALLELSGSVAANETIIFSGAGGVLQLADAASFNGEILGYGAGDVITGFAGADLSGGEGLDASRIVSYTQNTLILDEGFSTSSEFDAALNIPGIDPSLIDFNGLGAFGYDEPGFSNPGAGRNINVFTWTSGSAEWDAANWGGADPGADDSAYLLGTGLAYTVSFATTATIFSLYEDPGATLQISGGTLVLEASADGYARGSVAITGGTLDIVGYYGGFNGGTALQLDGGLSIAAGGELLVQAGSVDDESDGADVIDGTVAGAGVLILEAEGGTTIGPAADLSIGHLEFGAIGSISLESDLSYAGVFSGAGWIDANGHTFSVTGISQPAGIYAPVGLTFTNGELLVAGLLDADTASFYGAATLAITGTLVEAGVLALGSNETDAVTMTIASGGVLDLVPPLSGTGGYYGTIINDGLLEQPLNAFAGGAGAVMEAASFVSTGTILAASGMLLLGADQLVLGGTIGGDGTVDLNGAATLLAGLELEVATLVAGGITLAANEAYAGNYDLDGVAAGGFNLSLGGEGQIGNGFSDGILLDSGAADIDGLTLANASLQVTGLAQLLSGRLLIGANAAGADGTGAMSIAATGTLDIFSNAQVLSYGTGALTNAGLIELDDTQSEALIGSPFGTLTVLNTGEILAVTGVIDIQDSLTNDGLVQVDKQGGVIVTGAVTGTGVFIDDPSTIELDGAVGSGQTVDFAGAGGTLNLGDPSEFDGTIAGFTAGDVINFTSLAVGDIIGASFANGVLTLAESAGSITLDFAGSSIPNGASFNLQGSTATTEITLPENAECFLAGTRIMTPQGAVAVERLEAGDAVLTLAGRTEQVQWIGRRSYDARFAAAKHLVRPVCIKMHAIADGIPERDLFVSPGHGIFIDDVLVPAWRLINGKTITQPEITNEIRYYHIELASHAVIWAENCPAESYLDIGDRRQFQNATAGTERAVAAKPLPRADSGTVLQAIKARLNARAGVAARVEHAARAVIGHVDHAGPRLVSGWALCPDDPEAPVSLDVYFWIGGTLNKKIVLANVYSANLRITGLCSGCHGFVAELPEGAAGVRVLRTADRTELAFAEMAREPKAA